MEINEMIAVLQAHKEGKAVQFKSKTFSQSWIDVRGGDSLGWDFSAYNYRIKPEPPKPREFWITIGGQVWGRREHAEQWFRNESEAVRRVIHVREVLDENTNSSIGPKTEEVR